MEKMDMAESDTLVRQEVKSKRYSTKKICCVLSVCLLIAIVVAGLGFGIHQAVMHLKSSEKSDQISQKSPISIQLQTSVSPSPGIERDIKGTTMVLQDIVPTSAISPSPTVLEMTSSVNVKENTMVVSSWSRWLPWTSCSTSCGGGVQTRKRICGYPLPNKQPTCYGQPSQTRNCSEWKCPDCSKVCAVGKLNSGCDACICTNNTFSGKVLNEGRVPLDNVTVALAEFPFNILATTTSAGFFEVQGICVSDEDIFLKRPGYTPETVKAIQISPTEASVEVTLAAIVYPEVTVHPESKLRFEGDNVTFCCEANAKPDPLYEWIINGLSGDKYQYDVSNGSQVIIPQLNKNMSGEVKCRAYNDYGAEFSNVATLKVLERVVDTCNSTPAQRLSSLPSGCIHVETNSTTVDLGECSNEKCIGQYLGRTSTCVDKNYCCRSKTDEQIRIKCASGFYINLTRITSCGCGECSTPVSTVSGVAKGGKDNTPFVYGFIFSANGKRLARTRADGSFSFTVPPGTTRLVITFKDLSNYNNFYELTKVVPFAVGSETFVNIRMRPRPPPITVDATEGFEIPLGGNGTGNENLPAAAISMPPKSLLTADGKIYNGSVKATVDFVDPRNGSEVEEADGDFSATSEDGEQQLLETFGVMRMDFKDDKGSKLEPSTDIDVLLDLDRFNLTAEGAAAIKLWFMDEKTGRWRLMDSELKENRQRRSKRSKRLFFFGKIDRDKYYHSVNLDKITGQCAINVRTTEDGAILTVLVKTSSGTNQYRVYTLKSGDQCIETFCTENGATLQVAFKGDNLFPNDNDLVTRFQVDKYGIMFHADTTSAGRFTNRITMQRIPRELDPPFYPNIAQCNAKKSGSNLAFVFETIGSNQQFKDVLKVPKEVRNTKPQNGYEYWYTKIPGDLCFFKISVENVKECNDKNERPYFHVESFVENQGQLRTVGYTLLSPKEQDGYVCAEFRCPRSESDKVAVKLTSLTPRVRLYKHNTQFCDYVSSVSESSINGHIFEFSPKYSGTLYAAGIAHAFAQNMEMDMYAVNKPYIDRICRSLSPAMQFKCQDTLQK